MVLYHILSIQRLSEKLKFAEANGGKLMLTTHNPRKDMSHGRVTTYIHCLPYLVGGINFSMGQEATVIKIKLSPKAKVWNYRGEQSLVNFSLVETGTDLIHTMYDNEKFFKWQEVLLVSNDNVENWTTDQKEIKNDYIEQLEMLKAGVIHQDHFFYRDFTTEEQYNIAKLVGHHVGLEVFSPQEVKFFQQCFDDAYKRIEKKYGILD